MDALTSGSSRRQTVRCNRMPEIRPEAPSPTADGQEAFTRFLRSLRRHRLLVAATTIAGVLLAAVAGLFIRPTYSSQALLIIDLQSARTAKDPGGGAPGPAQYDAENSAIETHIAMMQSDTYLRLMLNAYPELGDESSLGPLAKSLYKCEPARPEMERAGEHKSAFGAGYPALNRLRRNLTVTHEGMSKIVRVSYRARTPLRAAAGANAFADTYVATVTCRERNAAERAAAAVDQQIREVRSRMAAADLALQNFRPKPGDGGQAGFAAIEGQIAALGRRRAALARRRQTLAEIAQTVRPDIELVAAAQPPNRPSSLPPILLVPPATIAFALLGCFLAVVRDRFDRAIHDATEAAALGLPCLATLPEIADVRPSAIRHLLRDEPDARYCNAVRAIFAATALPGSRARSHKTVLVTSSLAGEGKTTLAWSLALYAARLEWKVVVVDCGNGPTDAECDFGRLARNAVGAPERSVESGIDLGVDRAALSCWAGEPLALLSTPAMRALMREMKKTYDLVVVDVPCMLDRPEAGILIGWASSVVLAVRCGRTSRDSVRAALSLLGRGDDPGGRRAASLGLVLTQQAMRRRGCERWAVNRVNRFARWGLAHRVKRFAALSLLPFSFLAANIRSRG